jgi:hypothetical protein
MVAAVRSGESQRAVARRFGIGLATVNLWVQRSAGKELDQVDWEDNSHAPYRPARATPEDVKRVVLGTRTELREQSDLGEYGAYAIRKHLLDDPGRNGDDVPSASTINRILRAQGLFDGRKRVRRASPPAGWHIPEVAARRADIDETDFTESLYLEGGLELNVLNLISLHGGWCASWLNENMQASFVRGRLLSHWREFGLPGYAQFDNGNMFVGPKQHPDAIGSVIRMCVSLQVTPVFAIPNEFGIQSAIEGYNNQWKQKVWQRFHFDDKEQAQAQSDRYVTAVRNKRQARHEAAPARRVFPDSWREPENLCRQGQVIFLRRTGEHGHVQLLGRQYPVSPNWCHRIVRCEVDLDQDVVRAYGLRRSEPEKQPLLKEWSYRLPDPKGLKASNQD